MSRRKHHREPSAFHSRLLVNVGQILGLLYDARKEPVTNLFASHLSTTVSYNDLDLVTTLKEFPNMLELEVEVVLVGFRSKPYLLDGYLMLMLPGLFGTFALFVPVLAIVHDPAHRRVGFPGNLDKIEFLFPGDSQPLGNRHNTHLLTVAANDANGLGYNLVIDPCTSGSASLSEYKPASFRRMGRKQNGRTPANSGVRPSSALTKPPCFLK